MKPYDRSHIPPSLSHQPPQREADYRLAQDTLRGDAGAWEQLYTAAYPAVLRTIERYDDRHLLSADTRRDIADESFARCYNHLERYQGRSRFRHWVSGYAKNIIRNQKRKHATMFRHQWLLLDRACSDKSHLDPLLLLIRLERDRCLWDAFSICPLQNRSSYTGGCFSARRIAHWRHSCK